MSWSVLPETGFAKHFFQLGTNSLKKKVDLSVWEANTYTSRPLLLFIRNSVLFKNVLRSTLVSYLGNHSKFHFQQGNGRHHIAWGAVYHVLCTIFHRLLHSWSCSERDATKRQRPSNFVDDWASAGIYSTLGSPNTFLIILALHVIQI